MTESKQLIIFRDKKSLLEEANRECAKVGIEFQKSIKYYFIARYFVAIFESRNHEIPIQVWNEYRNALDHFFRSLTLQEKGDHTHLIKMEGHLLRACLDILKIFTHTTIETYESQRALYSKEVYDLIDNGKFYETIITQSNLISRNFEHAKLSDSRLGKSEIDDLEIIDNYLDAAFYADILMLNLISREMDCINAKQKLDNLYHSAHKKTTWEHLKIHGLSHIVFAGIGVGLTMLFNNYSDDLDNMWNHTFSTNQVKLESKEFSSATKTDKRIPDTNVSEGVTIYKSPDGARHLIDTTVDTTVK